MNLFIKRRTRSSFAVNSIIHMYSKEPVEQKGNTSTTYGISFLVNEAQVFRASPDILITNDLKESWADETFDFVPDALNTALTAGYSVELSGIESDPIVSDRDELRYE